MILKLEKNEICTIINALDFYSRIWIGQYDRLLYDIRWYKNIHKLDDMENNIISDLMSIRNILLPELTYGFHSSYGIFSPEIDYRAGVAYNMQQEFRYKLAWFEYPAGGVTVNFNPPLRVESDPYDKPNAECKYENEKLIIEVDICKEQLDIILSALHVNHAKQICDIVSLFSVYTNNNGVFTISQHLTSLLSNIETEYFDCDNTILYEKLDNFRNN